MKQATVVFLLLCIAVPVWAQPDSYQQLKDLQAKMERLDTVACNVTLWHKGFYDTDTTRSEGSVVADYTAERQHSSFFVSIHEKEYQRYLVYDTSGVEYCYYSKTKSVREVKKVDLSQHTTGGLLEPLFPMILDKAQQFHQWFFADYSRIHIVQMNDSILIVSFNGVDSNQLKESPKLWLEFYRTNGLPKTIVTTFILATGEVQYDRYTMQYDLNGDDREQHRNAYRRIRKVLQEGSRQQQVNEETRFTLGQKWRPFSVTTMSGLTKNLTQPSRKWLLVEFSYIACKPCQESIPALNKLAMDFGDELEVVSINPFDKKEEIGKETVRRNRSFEVYTMQKAPFQKLRVKRFPFVVLVGTDGRINMISTGYGEGFYERIANVIRQRK